MFQLAMSCAFVKIGGGCSNICKIRPTIPEQEMAKAS
jgi:hypothetical protein